MSVKVSNLGLIQMKQFWHRATVIGISFKMNYLFGLYQKQKAKQRLFKIKLTLQNKWYNLQICWRLVMEGLSKTRKNNRNKTYIIVGSLYMIKRVEDQTDLTLIRIWPLDRFEPRHSYTHAGYDQIEPQLWRRHDPKFTAFKT